MNPYIITKDFDKNFSSKRKNKKDEFNFWINYTFSLLLGFTILIFIYYIWILNINATKWYDIRNLEIERQNLLLQKELLDVQISNLESLKNIEQEHTFDNLMEEVKNPDFAVIKSWVNYAFNN